MARKATRNTKTASAQADKPQAGAKAAPAAQDNQASDANMAATGGGKPVPPPATPSGLVVVVVGPAKGFRRAGRQFGPEETVIPLEELTEEEQATLMAEPRLAVTTREAAEE